MPEAEEPDGADERSAAVIVERLQVVATAGGTLVEAAEEVAGVPRRTPAVLSAARRLAASLDGDAVRGQVVRFLDLLADSGLMGVDRQP